MMLYEPKNLSEKFRPDPETQRYLYLGSHLVQHSSFKTNCGLSKICGRQPLKNLKGHGLLKKIISFQVF